MFNRTIAVTASANGARYINAPGVLPLSPPVLQRRASTSPQSPLSENIVLQSVPAEVVYPHPSFGQMYTEAQGITSFLDLYQKDAEEDVKLETVKSPTSRDATHTAWVPLVDIVDPGPDLRRRGALRRSHSLSDLKGLRMAETQPTARRTSETGDDTVGVSETGVFGTEPSNSDIPTLRLNDEELPTNIARAQAGVSGPRSAALGHRRGRSLEEQGTNSSPRVLGTRPIALKLPPLPPPSTPLPSPPSALLAVKSPRPDIHALSLRRLPHPYVYAPVRSSSSAKLPLKSPQAPYWVRTQDMPKTPRTVRSERRQGWGGQWNVGNVGRVVNQLKEI
ncbi:hypothetical protein EIP86_002156 [Pleurotus ostreatoroseus]|nr:hypothetical protein EIP86_002156 [Pleurotus ostreatoroseus]